MSSQERKRRKNLIQTIDAFLIKCMKSGFVLTITFVSVFAAIGSYVFEFQERQNDRYVRQQTLLSLAWDRIDKARETKRYEGHVQALEVLAHLQKEGVPVSFYEVDLSGLPLSGVNLVDTYLPSVNFSSADLFRSTLSGAGLNRANLKEAYVVGAKLDYVDFRKAELSGMKAANTDFRHSHFIGTNLDGVYFRAHRGGSCGNGGDAGVLPPYRPKPFQELHDVWEALETLFLQERDEGDWICRGKITNVDYADFYEASMKGAHFLMIDFTKTYNLTQEQVDSACFEKSKLPKGLVAKEENCK